MNQTYPNQQQQPKSPPVTTTSHMLYHNHHPGTGSNTNSTTNSGTTTATGFEDEFFSEMFHPHHQQSPSSAMVNITDDYPPSAFMLPPTATSHPHHPHHHSPHHHSHHHQQPQHQAFFSNLIRMQDTTPLPGQQQQQQILPTTSHQHQHHYHNPSKDEINASPSSSLFSKQFNPGGPVQQQHVSSQDEGTEHHRVGLHVKICDPSGAVVEGCKRDKKYQIIVESCAPPVGCRDLSLTLIGLTKHAVLNPETRLIKTASQIIQQFKMGQPIEALVQRSGVIPIHSICFDTLGNPNETSFPSILKGKATNDHVWELGKPYVKNTSPRTYSIDLVFKISSNDNSALLHKFQKGYIVLVQGNCILDAVSTRVHQVAKNLKRSLSTEPYYSKGKTSTTTTTTGALQVHSHDEDEEEEESYPAPKKQKLKDEYRSASTEDNIPNSPSDPFFESRWIRLKILHTSKDNTNQVHTEFPLAVHNTNYITVGRGQSCHFCINDSLMSREHFRVDFQQNPELHTIQSMQITPLSNREIRLKHVKGSTWEKVTSATTLSVGDQILLGMTKLKLIDISQDE